MPARADPNYHGILLVDKARGWTSHDVVAKVRRLAGQRQVGHTGTLDPMATGLLLICLGNATRLVEYMVGHDKSYEGEIALGTATTTDDAEGEVTVALPVPALDRLRLDALEREFTGVINQRPPSFSAVKVAGRRAYAVARKGETVALDARPVQVRELALTSPAPGTLSLRTVCGAGTYIRSLARDIGEALGTAAHLAALRRTSVGRFSVGDARDLDELANLAARGELAAAVLPPDEGVTELDVAILDVERALRVAHGGRIQTAASRESGPIRIYDSRGEFVGIGAVSGDSTLSPVKVLTL